MCRFAIDNDGTADWTAAEGQVRNHGTTGATVVSIKSKGGVKRKADADADADVEASETKDKVKKGARRGKKAKR